MRNAVLALALILITIASPEPARSQSSEPVLINPATDFHPGQADLSDARTVVKAEGALSVMTGHEKPWPGITIKAPLGKWDLSGKRLLLMDVTNTGTNSVTVSMRVDNPGANGREHCVTASITLAPAESGTIRAPIFPSRYKLSRPLTLIGMRGYPVYDDKLDPTNITQLVIFVNHPDADHQFEISNIHAAGVVQVLDVDKLFPMIDRFGQFIHSDWPGKTHSVAELKAATAAELKDVDANPAPDDRDIYGGYTAGPAFRTKGFFRVEKYNGKWWLIDPLGRLFFSHGVDCVGSSVWTPITDRENYFADLPGELTPLGKYYGAGTWAPHGYYKDHTPYKTFDFGRANLYLKYGPNWSAKFTEMTQRRLASWGMNTIANWSDPGIYRTRKTPYVATVSFNSRTIEGSEGYWGKFFDVFDPSFRRNMQAAMKAQIGQSTNDPWCIGYFVHNEIAWGDETSLALAALTSPADQPAKIAFVKDLKTRYSTIEALNKQWGSNYADFDDLLKSTTPPDKSKADADLKAFYTKIAETYFSIIREEVKKVAPDILYMGCRFAWVNDRAVRAAAKYCDVISFNRYTYSVANLSLPEGVDKPIIIGEFHFGALDRGLFHTGLRATNSQADRAQKYTDYLLGALQNPYIVGTHWFQYKDQATTGRGDGENYQIGFLDICDHPYPEIVAAARSIGKQMYATRLKQQ